MSKHLIHILFTITTVCSFVCCSEQKEHTAPAIHDRDSVPVMTTYGVNTLISDSGVIKYRIVTERWEINENRRPSRWTFNKGILLTQFDLKKHVVGYIQCDSAVYFDKDRRWELRGRVRILTAQGLNFYSNELYWDERNHEMWSYSYSHLKTPDKELQGNWFHSDEQMDKITRYDRQKGGASSLIMSLCRLLALLPLRLLIPHVLIA